MNTKCLQNDGKMEKLSKIEIQSQKISSGQVVWINHVGVRPSLPIVSSTGEGGNFCFLIIWGFL